MHSRCFNAIASNGIRSTKEFRDNRNGPRQRFVFGVSNANALKRILRFRDIPENMPRPRDTQPLHVHVAAKQAKATQAGSECENLMQWNPRGSIKQRHQGDQGVQRQSERTSCAVRVGVIVCGVVMFGVNAFERLSAVEPLKSKQQSPLELATNNSWSMTDTILCLHPRKRRWQSWGA